jgi:HAD superfamily hydrolase (TIGR01509 family)
MTSDTTRSIDPSRFEAIIFDLGGVIINLDLARTYSAFEQLGVTAFREHFALRAQSPIFDCFECGELEPHQFRAGLREAFKLQLSDHDLDQAWNALLLDIPPGRLRLLKSLRERHRTFLLSNTNAIHLAAINAYVQREHSLSELDQVFEHAYYSHQVGLRKPNAEIYRHVLEEQQLDPARTLFIDDAPANIAGANAVGLQTCLLGPGLDLLELFTGEHGAGRDN